MTIFAAFRNGQFLTNLVTFTIFSKILSRFQESTRCPWQGATVALFTYNMI